jgi:hypothetical protein
MTDQRKAKIRLRTVCSARSHILIQLLCLHFRSFVHGTLLEPERTKIDYIIDAAATLLQSSSSGAVIQVYNPLYDTTPIHACIHLHTPLKYAPLC